MIIKLKIPRYLSSHLVNKRELRNVYETNRMIKVYGFFAVLKTFTSSGLIKNYHNQIEVIGQLTKKSRSSVYNYLNFCKKLQLIKMQGNVIVLSSWENATKIIDEDIFCDLYTELNYDVKNGLQTPEYLIYAAEIKENQDAQTNAVIREVGNNLPLAQLLAVDRQVTPEHVQKLANLQVFTFVNGKSENDYLLIHSVRADVQRTAKSIRKAYNMKSRRSVKYLKRQLVRRGIATVFTRCHTSECRNRISSMMYSGYFKEVASTFWKQPDLITLKVA